MNNNLIECSKLSYSYENGRKVLDNIDFCAKSGETIGLIGANGVGKSTLLRIFVGLETGYSGNIMVDGYDVIKKNLTQIRKHTGYVFQDSENQLFMTTVAEDIAFGPKNYGLSDEEADERVKDALEKVGANHLADRQVWKISGGEKKLASIASVLAMKPEIIIMDEPSIALDPKNRRRLISVINALEGLKIIASHDLDMILDTCERVILMDGGRVVKDGETQTILRDRAMLESAGLELPLCLSRI